MGDGKIVKRLYIRKAKKRTCVSLTYVVYNCCGVKVSFSAWPACCQCCSTGSSLGQGLHFPALAGDIFWSMLSLFVVCLFVCLFPEYSSFLPSFIGRYFKSL